jgi:excisionase family DNA binding protein
MSKFAIPPLPGENLLTVTQVAERAGCTREAIYKAIEDGKISAARAAGYVVIAESEANQFIRDWPAPKRPDAAARWREYRAWKRQQAEARAA